MTARVLYAASEMLPLSKTGGLADVAHALPRALHRLGLDLRVVTPAYRGTAARLLDARTCAAGELRGRRFTILEGRAEADGPPVWLVDCPALFGGDGAPYTDAQGRERADNPARFGAFCELVARLALDHAGAGWRPDVVHLNDWHTGLAAVWIARAGGARPGVVFTIHNLAYQGNFPRRDYDALGLPPELWHMHALEFHGGFSFLKAGLLYADRLTTVSPTYAREIQTPAFGERMDGVLRSRADALQGIANGIDADAWNPATDRFLAQTYDRDTVQSGKRANKRAVRRELGLEPLERAPLLGVVGRLAYQKGADLLLHAATWVEQSGLQVALLGSGDPALERAFQDWSRRMPGRVAVRIGYDEGLAHRIEAGANLFLMPSRYEPCGLNQLYSQRYGTIPVVRRTGGLADTVVDATPENLARGTATGVLFEHADTGGVIYGLDRALQLRREPDTWSAMQRAGMSADYSWGRAAGEYLGLYERLARARGAA